MSKCIRRSGGIARRLPLALAIGAAILFIALGGRHYVSLGAVAENARWLHDSASRWAIIAPIVFISINAVILMMLVVPSSLCTIACGLLFGQWLGSIYGLAGSTLGATAVFLMARAGLGDLAERAGPRVAGIAAGFRADAFRYLLVLRLVPLCPFALVSIAAALGGQSIRSYVLATVIGMVPSVVIYAGLGDLLMDLARHGQLPGTNLMLQPKFLLPMLGLAGLASLGLLLRSASTASAGRKGVDPGTDD